jgi:Holliday junction resolvase RusA-like endonuclease
VIGTAYILEIPGHHFARDNQLIGCHPCTASSRKSRDKAAVARANMICAVPLVAIPPAERAVRKELNISLDLPNDPRPRRRRVSVVATDPAYSRPQCRPDPLAIYKSLLDSLVHAGLLVDDSGVWCEPVPAVYRAGEKMTTIYLEDIE